MHAKWFQILFSQGFHNESATLDPFNYDFYQKNQWLPEEIKIIFVEKNALDWKQVKIIHKLILAIKINFYWWWQKNAVDSESSLKDGKDAESARVHTADTKHHQCRP